MSSFARAAAKGNNILRQRRGRGKRGHALPVIGGTLYRPAGPAPHLKRRAVEVLKQHRGVDNAIISRDLQVAVGLGSTRDLGSSIRELVNALIDDGFVVGASNRGRGGYFLCDSSEDYRIADNNLASRQNEIQERRRKLRSNWECHGVPRQGALDLIDPTMVMAA